jgi:uncharacterized membrane protein YGL010W
VLDPTLQAWFDDYLDHHRHPTNRLTHEIAIPMIVFHIVAMLDWLQIRAAGFATIAGETYGLSVGHLFAVGVLAWYATMSPKLAAIMAVASVPLFALSALTPWWVVVVVAAAGWTIQLAGHKVWEKRAPAFLGNLGHALIGPLFFVAVLTGDYAIPTTAEAS